MREISLSASGTRPSPFLARSQTRVAYRTDGRNQRDLWVASMCWGRLLLQFCRSVHCLDFHANLSIDSEYPRSDQNTSCLCASEALKACE